MFASVVLDYFFSTKPKDWLRRTSSEWPILCRVGRKTQSINQFWTCGTWFTGSMPLVSLSQQSIHICISLLHCFRALSVLDDIKKAFSL